MLRTLAYSTATQRVVLVAATCAATCAAIKAYHVLREFVAFSAASVLDPVKSLSLLMMTMLTIMIRCCCHFSSR